MFFLFPILGLERVAEELMGRRKWTHIEQQEENTDFQADILPAEPKNATGVFIK